LGIYFGNYLVGSLGFSLVSLGCYFGTSFGLSLGCSFGASFGLSLGCYFGTSFGGYYFLGGIPVTYYYFILCIDSKNV
jgi:hypothetical protein